MKVYKLGLVMLLGMVMALTGCSLYRPDLQQGNYVAQNSLNELRPNMTKHQVQEIMGTPAITPFFKLDQWNYSFAYLDGQHRDQPLKFQTLSLYFRNNKLQSYSSNAWHPANLPQKK